MYTIHLKNHFSKVFDSLVILLALNLVFLQCGSEVKKISSDTVDVTGTQSHFCAKIAILEIKIYFLATIATGESFGKWAFVCQDNYQLSVLLHFHGFQNLFHQYCL